MFCFCVADVIVVFVERKRTSYVYAVGKQSSGNLWCKMGEHGTASCEMWDGGRYAFCLLYVYYFTFQRFYLMNVYTYVRIRVS